MLLIKEENKNQLNDLLQNWIKSENIQLSRQATYYEIEAVSANTVKDEAISKLTELTKTEDKISLLANIFRRMPRILIDFPHICIFFIS